jgi:hypothetical protein
MHGAPCQEVGRLLQAAAVGSLPVLRQNVVFACEQHICAKRCQGRCLAGLAGGKWDCV